jgi:DedD protein
MLGETDDDVTLRGRRIDERHSSDRHDTPADREVTLNTGTVLALFFTLALICAVFFGFGYSMGRKSQQAVPVASSDSTPAAAPETTAADKPAPGSPAIQSVPGYQSSATSDAGSKTTVTAPTVKLSPAASASQTPDTASSVVRKPIANPDAADGAAAKAAPVVRTPPAAATAPVTTYNSAVPATGITYVQIAAVSHQEDADVLLSALQRRGYKVLARTDTADKLIHVQIGPFTDRKQAEVTRQKLIGDGYNAFLK